MLFTVLVLIFIPLSLLLPPVQNCVGGVISNIISNDLGTEISFSSIYIEPIRSISINDFLIKDQHKDTLFYIKNFTASIADFSLSDKYLYFDNITAEGLESNIKTSKKGVNNYTFIVDSLRKGNTKSSDWKFTTRSFAVKNSKLSYFNPAPYTHKTNINLHNIKLDKFNFILDSINMLNDSLSLHLKDLSFKEHNGFVLDTITCNLGCGKRGLDIESFKMKTRNTSLLLSHFKVKYDSLRALKDIWNGPVFDIKINSFSSTSNDMRQFVPSMPELKDMLYLKGVFSGTLNDIKGKSVYLSVGKGTNLQTNFQVNGASKLDDAYLYLNIRKLKTTSKDILKFLALGEKTKNISLGKAVNSVGNVEFKGNMSGFLDDIVAYGLFKTNLGNIKTDIGMKTEGNGNIEYSGTLNTKQFNFGKLLNSERNLNKVTLAVSVKGYRNNDKQYKAFVNGKIDSIDVNGYKYEQVKLKGYLSNKMFNGNVRLNDPNADLEFDGQVDFRNKVPQVDFVASVNELRPQKLNLSSRIKDGNIAFDVVAKLKGPDINDINGNVSLYNCRINAQKKHFKLDTLSFNTAKINGVHYLTITSDLIQAALSGKFDINTVPEELKYYLNEALPSLFNKKLSSKNNYQTKFRNSIMFDIETKHLSSLLNIISPDINIADGSTIHGELDSKKQSAGIVANLKSVNIGGLSAYKVGLKVDMNKGYVSTAVDLESLKFTSLMNLKNFNLKQRLRGDSIMSYIHWDDEKDTANSKGHLLSKFNFKRSADKQLYTKLRILPSTFTVNDSIWTIRGSNMYFEPNGFSVDTFRVYHKNQEFGANGVLENKKADLLVNVQDIDLSRFSSLQKTAHITLAGIMYAKIYFLSGTDNPVVSGKVNIKGLGVNDAILGDLLAESKWDKDKQKVLFNANVTRGSLDVIKGGGYFTPKTKDYNLDFKADSVPMGFLNAYLGSVMQNIKGTGSGNIGLRKTDDGLGLDGKVGLNHVKFDVDFTKCSYFIDDTITLKPHSLIFNDITITDVNNKKGLFRGSIKHTNFQNMTYDLALTAKNMQLLNTKEADNASFYGSVYGTGTLGITGPSGDMDISIKVKNGKNTHLYIPLSNGGESLNNSFIRFYNSNEDSASVKTQYDDYVPERSSYDLQMNLSITPEAEVQVVFDPEVGDLLKTNGSGDLQINLNKDKDLSFFGAYKATGGEYLFSLENVVNKRFDINEGGTITWQGDPYDAIIDLTATYKLKTSITPLVQTGIYSATTLTGETSRRVPINCDLVLGNSIKRPSIRFEINAPTLEQTTQNLIKDAINTQEELNRQVLSLLVLNRFYTPEYNTGQNAGVSDALSTNASELVSSQFSNLLSNISKDVDVGFAWRPETDISSQEIELALSTQIFNDRVTLNGNFEYGKYNTNSTIVQQGASNIVGDFDMEVKLNKKGNLRAKVYTKSNDDFSYDNSPSTQGLGLSYKKEFNSFGELLRNFWHKIFGKGKLNDKKKK